MDHATVALLFLLAFSCAICAAAVRAAAPHAAAFRYPDDDHVIITQYGPMRYEPVSAEQMNRPHDRDQDQDVHGKTPSRGYFKAEVIPLDMKTWKPLRPGSDGYDGAWVDRRAVGPPGARAAAGPGRFAGAAAAAAGPGRSGTAAKPAAEFDTIDVPLRVGFSVQRPAKPVVRRRRHDYLLASPHGYLHRYPAGTGAGPGAGGTDGTRAQHRPQPAAAHDLWRPT